MAILAGFEVDVFVDNIFNFPTLAEAYGGRARHRQATKQQSLRSVLVVPA